MKTGISKMADQITNIDQIIKLQQSGDLPAGDPSKAMRVYQQKEFIENIGSADNLADKQAIYEDAYKAGLITTPPEKVKWLSLIHI